MRRRDALPLRTVPWAADKLFLAEVHRLDESPVIDGGGESALSTALNTTFRSAADRNADLDAGKSPKSLSSSVLAQALRLCLLLHASKIEYFASLAAISSTGLPDFAITSSCFTKELMFISLSTSTFVMLWPARQREAPMRIWDEITALQRWTDRSDRRPPAGATLTGLLFRVYQGRSVRSGPAICLRSDRSGVDTWPAHWLPNRRPGKRSPVQGCGCFVTPPRPLPSTPTQRQSSVVFSLNPLN